MVSTQSVVNGNNATLLNAKNSLCYLIPKPYLVGFPLFYKLNNSEHVKKNSVKLHFALRQLTKLKKILIACYKNSVEWHFEMCTN